MQWVGGAGATGQSASFHKCRFVRFGSDEAIVRAWRRLEETASLPTQSYAFAAALSHTLLADARLAILIAPGVDGGNALLPLCRDKGYFARWRTMGSLEVFEPVDALCTGAEGAGALAETIVRQSRPLRLDRIPAASALVPALQKAIKGKGYLSVRPAVPTPTISLDEGWKTPEARFNARRRSDFRRAARRASEFGAVSFEVLAPGLEAFDSLFDEAIGVELRSWKKAAGTAIAVDRDKEQFFRDFLRAASGQGILRIALLRIGGQAVAMQLALESLGRYWLFKIGYDETFGKCSPGTLLMLHTLAWAAERGLRSYELLGSVEPWIAELWTQQSHECVRLRTYPFGIRGAAAFAFDSIGWAYARLRYGT